LPLFKRKKAKTEDIDGKTITDEETSKQAKWQCNNCGTLNKVDAPVCQHCGVIRRRIQAANV
jgi:hypothetical protein